jgi:hypothetical protein
MVETDLFVPTQKEGVMSTAESLQNDRDAAKQLGLVTLAWLVFVFGSSLLMVLFIP